MNTALPPQSTDPLTDPRRFRSGPHAGDRLLTVNDMAELLNSTPAGIRSTHHRGRLPKSHKIGGRRMWWESEVSAWIDAQSAADEAEGR